MSNSKINIEKDKDSNKDKACDIDCDIDCEYYRKILYLITITVDLVLLYIYQSQELNGFDKFYVITILGVHMAFMYSLYTNNHNLIDNLHYTVVVYVGISIFLKNRLMVGLLLAFIIVIQATWILYEDCVINKITNNSIGFGDVYSKLSIIYTIILSYKFLFIKRKTVAH